MSVDLPIEEFMKRDLLECAPSMSVRQAAARMHDACCGSILIVDEGKAVGIWTETDVLSSIWNSVDDLDQPVSAFMSSPVKSIPARTTLGEATRRFRLEGVRHFLVNDSRGCPVGIISQTDVVRNQGVAFFLRARTVDSVIQEAPIFVDVNALFSAVRELMHECNLDAVVVRADERYGIITTRDMVGALGVRKIEMSAGELASFPLLTIALDGTLLQALDLFAQNRIRHLGVLDEQQLLIGLLTFRDLFDNIESDLVNGLLPELEQQTEKLLQSRRELARQASLTDAILNALPINVFVKDDMGRVIIANEMVAQLIGRPLSDIVGRTDEQLFPAEVARRLIEDDTRVRASNRTLVREELLGNGRILLAHKRMIEVEGVSLLIGASMDVSESKRADALMVSDHHLLELIACGGELPLVLETLCRRMETHLPGALCSIMLLDADGLHLRHGAAPSLPPGYSRAFDGVAIGASLGSCGAAVSLGEQVIVQQSTVG
jgi:CBS domain-containing protein